MNNQSVTSQEYKLMLNVDRFLDLDRGGAIFAGLLEFLIVKEGGRIEKRQNEIEMRWTSYLDTAEMALHRRGFSLRKREVASGKFQLTLKYRVADRYLSAAQNLTSSLEGKPKFEEDLTPPFAGKFSQSCSIKTRNLPEVKTLAGVAEVFPGLKGLGLDLDDEVRRVGNLRAFETVRKIFRFRFDDAHELKACLSFWRLGEAVEGWPLVAEFSFDYDTLDQAEEARLENFSPATVDGANRLFRAVQGQAGWVDFNITTKTAFAVEIL